MAFKSNTSIGILVFVLLSGMTVFFYWDKITFALDRNSIIEGAKPVRAHEINTVKRGDKFFFYISYPSGTAFYNYECRYEEGKIALLRQESILLNENCDGCEQQTYFVFKALQEGKTTILLENHPEAFTFPGMDIPIEIPIQIQEGDVPNL